MFGDSRAMLKEASLKMRICVLLIPLLGAPFIVSSSTSLKRCSKEKSFGLPSLWSHDCCNSLHEWRHWNLSNVRIDAPEPLQLLVASFELILGVGTVLMWWSTRLWSSRAAMLTLRHTRLTVDHTRSGLYCFFTPIHSSLSQFTLFLADYTTRL